MLYPPMGSPSSSVAEYIRDRQERHPPWKGVDRGAMHLSAFLETLPSELTEIYETGRLGVTEVGLAQPLAKKIPLPRRSYVVEFTSGMLEFLYSIARTLAAKTCVWDGGRIVVEPALPSHRVTQLYGKYF